MTTSHTNSPSTNATSGQSGDSQGPNYIEIASDIVAAYVSNNSVPVAELSQLIASVHTSLLSISTGAQPKMEEQNRTPAVNPKKSVFDDYIICLEDGKQFKSLKRHLRSRYNISPEEYRAKWGLAPDYPMVAPNYSKARSDLAKNMGLGSSRRADGAGSRGRRKATQHADAAE